MHRVVPKKDCMVKKMHARPGCKGQVQLHFLLKGLYYKCMLIMYIYSLCIDGEKVNNRSMPRRGNKRHIGRVPRYKYLGKTGMNTYILYYTNRCGGHHQRCTSIHKEDRK